MDKTYFLSQLAPFRHLERDRLELLSSKMRLVEYKKNETVYTQGDPPHAFYFVVFGKLKIFARTNREKQKILAYLHKGDFFGEISLLTYQPHSVTVTALNDCLLLKILKDDFQKILTSIPEISVLISQSLGKKLRNLEKDTSTTSASEVFSFYAPFPDIDKTPCVLDIATEIVKNKSETLLVLQVVSSQQDMHPLIAEAPKISLCNFTEDRLSSPQSILKQIKTHESGFSMLCLALQKSTQKDLKNIPILFDCLHELFDRTIINLPLTLDEYTIKFVEQSDKIFLIVDSTPSILNASKNALELLAETGLSVSDSAIELIVYHDTHEKTDPQLIKKTLGKQIYSVIPRLGQHDSNREKYQRALNRLSRKIEGNVIGLALGSGAALGLSHIGVLKVLEKHQIPIDILSGCSMGAFLGSLWACGIKAGQLEQQVMKVIAHKKLFSFFDITFPIRGFFRGRKVIDFLKKFIGEKNFADAEMDLKIVAADLLTREKIVFQEGPIYEAVRASISMPGIFEPLKKNGSLQVDGGILDPLPIHVLQEAGATKIIAVNALPDPIPLRQMHQEIADRGTEGIADTKKKHGNIGLLRCRLHNALSPGILDILIRSIQSMEAGLAESSCQDADITIRPLKEYHSYFDFFNAKSLIYNGERAAEKALPKIKQLLCE
ncbi:MAG: cyclic nucleotide-binding domain-containing protein [Candidatus Omnitrophica bacterium]|nr:cyclic nucleotide-binding domain-containing protein [Candidatus Omnitrophota bacterium]